MASASKRRARLIIAASVVWSLFLLAGIGELMLLSTLGDTTCELRSGDSNYGRSGWAFLPPGHTCMWTRSLNGVDAHEGPGWQASAYLVVLVGTGAAIVGFARRGFGRGQPR
jgi:hypothetical protein